MPLTAADLRRWLDGFEAAAAADRAARRGAKPDPAWALATALPLIEAARRALAADARLQAARARNEDAVRDVWRRLRASHARL